MINSSITFRRQNRRGRNLVGGIVILAIIGFMIYLGFDSDPGVEILLRARTETTKIFVRSVVVPPLKRYLGDMGELPSTTEGLTALLLAPANKHEKWKGPYLEVSPPDRMPIDPWLHDYVYRFPGMHNKDSYDIFSCGPDGIAGTDDDIGNWKPAR